MPSDKIEKSFGFICVRWLTSHEMDHSVCGEEGEGGCVNVRAVWVMKRYRT